MNRKWQPAPVLLPGKICGEGILAGYSEELDMTEQLSTHNFKIVDFT